MQSVNLANAVSELDEALNVVTEMGAELIQDSVSGLVKVWPNGQVGSKNHATSA